MSGPRQRSEHQVRGDLQGKSTCQSGKGRCKVKAGAKAKASGLKPVIDRVKFRGGWTMEVRVRPTGQKDKSYIGPHGKAYRMQHEAESAGFVAISLK